MARLTKEERLILAEAERIKGQLNESLGGELTYDFDTYFRGALEHSVINTVADNWGLDDAQFEQAVDELLDSVTYQATRLYGMNWSNQRVDLGGQLDSIFRTLAANGVLTYDSPHTISYGQGVLTMSGRDRLLLDVVYWNGMFSGSESDIMEERGNDTLEDAYATSYKIHERESIYDLDSLLESIDSIWGLDGRIGLEDAEVEAWEYI